MSHIQGLNSAGSQSRHLRLGKLGSCIVWGSGT